MAEAADDRYVCDKCERSYTRPDSCHDHMKAKHATTAPSTCRYCRRVFTDMAAMHGHLETVHGKVLHLCSHCGKNYVSEKSRKAHEPKCPKKPEQPQPQPQPQSQPQLQNDGDVLFAPDAREEAEDLGFDATLEVKEEKADEDDTTSQTTSDVVEASFGSEEEAGQRSSNRTKTSSSEDDDEDENDEEKAPGGKAGATFIVTAAHAASEEDDEDDDDEETPKEAALKGLAEAYASENEDDEDEAGEDEEGFEVQDETAASIPGSRDPDDNEDDDDDNDVDEADEEEEEDEDEVNEADNEEAEDDEDDEEAEDDDFVDTSVAASKAAEQKSATCGPLHPQSEAGGTSPEAEDEEGVDVRARAANPGPQDPEEEDEDDDEEDAAQRPVEAEKTFPVINVGSDEEDDDGISVVATVPPPPITIGDSDNEAEDAQPEACSNPDVAHFLKWVASLTEGQRTAFAPVLARKVLGHPQIEDDAPWNLIQAHTGIFIGWPWTDDQKDEFLNRLKALHPVLYLEYEMCLHAPPPPDPANFVGDLLNVYNVDLTAPNFQFRCKKCGEDPF